LKEATDQLKSTLLKLKKQGKLNKTLDEQLEDLWHCYHQSLQKTIEAVDKEGSIFTKNLKETLQSFDKTQAISIGMDVYKVRLKRHGKGKSGGYRMYVYVIEFESILAPVCIFAKSDKGDISRLELIEHVEKIENELGQHT
jgi:hypothetical protein